MKIGLFVKEKEVKWIEKKDTKEFYNRLHYKLVKRKNNCNEKRKNNYKGKEKKHEKSDET